MPPSKRKALKILEALQEAYPHVKTQLRHETPFQLLVATILSAQCTDRQVNAVTPRLFSELSTPRDFVDVPLERLEELIRSTGFFHTKARHIKECAEEIVLRHGGAVPNRIEDLLALPGVGRKTANVVLGAAFGVPAMVVDTHVARISRLLGLTPHKDPEKIEHDLRGLFPESSWNDLSLQFIYHGRAVCRARSPQCPSCTLRPWCDFGKKRAPAR